MDTVLAVMARIAVAILHGSTGLYKLIIGGPATAQMLVNILQGSWMPAEIIVVYSWFLPYLQVGIALWLISGLKLQTAWIFAVLLTWSLAIGSLIAGGIQTIAAVNCLVYIMICLVGLVFLRSDPYRRVSVGEASLQIRQEWSAIIFRAAYICVLLLLVVDRIYHGTELSPEPRPLTMRSLIVLASQLLLVAWLLSNRKLRAAWVATCLFFWLTAGSFELVGRFGMAVNYFRFGFIAVAALYLSQFDPGRWTVPGWSPRPQE